MSIPMLQTSPALNPDQSQSVPDFAAVGPRDFLDVTANSTPYTDSFQYGYKRANSIEPEDLLPTRILHRSLTDVDGFRTPLLRPKHHLRDVAKDVMTKLKIAKTFIDKLCDVCIKLQLTQDKFIIQDHSSDPNQQAYRSFLRTDRAQPVTSFPLGSGSGKFELGSLKQIRERSSRCPFCRLVHESLLDFHPDHEDLKAFADVKCSATWQVDGREVVRDDAGQIVSARPRTRRIQLRWEQQALEDSYLVLIAPERLRHEFDPQTPWESNTLFLGRNITSAGNNQALAKKWLDLCSSCHGKSCHIDRGRDFEEMVSSAFFGVVDVHEMRLTSLPSDQPYAALSYMWGNIDTTTYTTTLSNIQARQNPGELGKIFQALPQVIQDAINLVRGLGLKYIWVDSLCIVQDSSKSWNLNSSVMDLVYGNAYLTICAADGQDARTGLRGISVNRYVSQHSLDCGDVRLLVSHLAETYVEKSRWNTRAWTFQERLLSKRCLVFAGGRVFFQCGSAAMSEDIVAEQQKGGWSIELVQAPLQLFQALEKRAFWVYMECIRRYTVRELSRPRDILAAFQGISNLISQKLGAPLIFGLPSSHFDLALLWEPTQRSQRRVLTDADQHRGFEDLTFPSWSWCGWEGSAMEYRKETISGCLEDVRRWHANHTWISWYIRDSRGNLRLVWDRSHYSPKRSDEGSRWLGYHADSSDKTSQAPTDDYGRQLDPKIETLTRREFYRTLPEYPYKISIIEQGSFNDQRYEDQQYLQFWTWSAYLRVIPHDQRKSKLGQGLQRYDIADYTGDWCGTIVLDDPWTEAPGSEHEFIAISAAKEFSIQENDIWSYYIPRDREQSDWSLYYVLLIKTERGIARRLGLGKVFKDAFQNSCLPGMKWREIILA